MNLLHAQFEGVENGHGRFRIDGQPTRLPVDPAVARLAKGQVTIGIRPRALVLDGLASADAIAGRAELIEPMGAETLVHARTPLGSDIRVVVPREIRVKAGDSLRLRTEARETHVFDHAGRAVRT
jgi:ABC-type sugar transport system ATPase subunit